MGPIVLLHLGLYEKGPGGRRDVSDVGHQRMRSWEGTFLPVPWEERVMEAWVDMHPPANCLFFFFSYLLLNMSSVSSLCIPKIRAHQQPETSAFLSEFLSNLLSDTLVCTVLTSIKSTAIADKKAHVRYLG